MMRLALVFVLAQFQWLLATAIEPEQCSKVLAIGPKNTFIPDEICAKEDYFAFFLDSIIPQKSEDFKVISSFWQPEATKIMKNIILARTFFHQYLVEDDATGFVYRSIAVLAGKIPMSLSSVTTENAFLSVYMDGFSSKQLYIQLLDEKNEKLVVDTCKTLLSLDLIEGDLLKQYWEKGFPCQKSHFVTKIIDKNRLPLQDLFIKHVAGTSWIALLLMFESNFLLLEGINYGKFLNEVATNIEKGFGQTFDRDHAPKSAQNMFNLAVVMLRVMDNRRLSIYETSGAEKILASNHIMCGLSADKITAISAATKMKLSPNNARSLQNMMISLQTNEQIAMRHLVCDA
ncbi:hypothetical protein Ciccas_008419 [Cichlidogyrus casuarinus]|uniref:Uncharacterized protein n=1 Tax=Cichlidogyrus casuarinus TaxID=1844966 RepID=A0ABD2Q005_9PLAT